MYEYVRQDTSVYVCVSVKVAAAQRFVCRPRVRRDFFLMQINVYQMARALILKGWKVALNLYLIQAKSEGSLPPIDKKMCIKFKDTSNLIL